MSDETKVWISSRKLKSGKRSYYLRWIDVTTGKWRNQKVSTDRKRAEREAVLLEDELRKGTHVDVRHATWAEFAEEAVSLLDGSHADGAIQVLAEFGDLLSRPLPGRVRHTAIKAYVKHLEEKGNKQGTINKKLRYLRLAFNEGIKMECVAKNPLDDWNWKKVKRGTLRILTAIEEAKLFDAARELYGFRMWLFLRFTLETWGRLSEVTGLRWDDINFDNRSVTFRDTKSTEDRTIPIAESSSLLDDLRKLQVQTLQDGGPFLVYADGSSTAKKRIRILNVAGIPSITIHDLRRTGITRALLAGVPPITVQKLAGHMDIKTTMHYYAQVNFDDLRAGVEKQRAASLAG
ncbi:MAG: tyrosine-type recombinase/integrase [Planctomycetota bacterium]|nr:tyrosine-type recombinase/integrase [Planctomycetota bacterium]